MRTHFRLRSFSLGLCLACLTAGCGNPAQAKEDEATTAKVQRDSLIVTVVETGIVEAERAVEVKSRVTGRLARLLVQEGDMVREGQLIGVIDPQETELRVRQDEAQLRGAMSVVARSRVEIDQRRVTVQAAYNQARIRLAQLELEARTQPELTRAAIVSAQTSLATAQQERRRLVESGHPTQRTNAQREVDEAKANLDNAERELQRNVELLDRGFTAGKNVDNARLALDLAQVRHQTATENLVKLESNFRSELSKADQSIQQAEAELNRALANQSQIELKRKEVESARADLARAQAALLDPKVLAKQLEQSQATVDQLASVVSDSRRNLRETEIRSPISGIVTKRLLEIGELASGLSAFSPGTPIVRIEDRSTMRVRLEVNEIDTARLKLGMASEITVDALPHEEFSGVITRIAPASTVAGTAGQNVEAVVRYRVEVRIHRFDASLRSGMSAKCSMDVIKRDAVLRLPIEFIESENDRNYVLIPPVDPRAKDAEPTRREVKLGARSGAFVEVLSGVKEGEVVARPDFTGPERKGFIQTGPEEE